MAAVDLRLVGRPANFDGDENRWMEWAFQMRAYFVMAGLITAQHLDTLSAMEAVVLPQDIPEERRDSVASMYYVLAMHTRGKAQMLIKTVEPGNGYEAWRRLAKRYDRHDDQTVMGLHPHVHVWDGHPWGVGPSHGARRVGASLRGIGRRGDQRWRHEGRAHQGHARTTANTLAGELVRVADLQRDARCRPRVRDGKERLAVGQL